MPVDTFAESLRALMIDEPRANVAVITRDAERAGPGHYVWDGDALAIAGTWQIDVVTRVDEFTEIVTGLSVPVAP